MRYLVSIITPTFNDLNYVKETYESITNQTYTNWEWLVTDDCSNDGTYEYISSLAEMDARIKVFRNDVNSGAAVSRNVGINHSKGRFIAFVDADDLWEPSKLEVQIKFMLKNSIGLSYTDYSHIDEFGNNLNYIRSVADRVTYKSLLKENIIGCLTAIYDTEIVGKCYMPLIRKRQDFGLWLKILRNIEEARKCPSVLAKYRIRGNSISSNKLKLLKYNFELFHKYEQMPRYKAAYYLASNIVRKIVKNKVKK